MSGTWVAVGFTLAAGIGIAVQVATNGALGGRIGVIETGAFSALVSTLLLFGLALVTGRGGSGVGEALREPAWLWLGGLYGAIALGAIAFSPPRIGAVATIALLLAGQLAMGVLIDTLGLFGLARVELTPARVAGLVLLAAGAVLLVRR